MTIAQESGPRWVLLAAAATSRGFRNALACKRWCRSHGVELRSDGRKLWVRPADIDTALDRIAAGPEPSNDGSVLAAVESMKARR